MVCVSLERRYVGSEIVMREILHRKISRLFFIEEEFVNLFISGRTFYTSCSIKLIILRLFHIVKLLSHVDLF